MVTVQESSSLDVKRIRIAVSARIPSAAMASGRRGRIATAIVAAAVSMIVLTSLSYGQTGQVAAPPRPAATNPADPPSVNAATLSCKELKDALQRTGTLNVLAGQRGWPETFHGPEVPQCDIWSRPMFSYVSTNDGSCGLGYICAPRISGGR